MHTDTVTTGFGRYLQAIRLEKGIPLENISEETRIGLSFLKSIEQEALDELPADVFLKGFLRAYSKFIGADGNEVIRRYEAQREVARKIAKFEEEPKRHSTGSLWKLAMALFLLGLVMVFSISGMGLWEMVGHSEADQQGAAQSALSSGAGATATSQQKLQQTTPATTTNGLVLKISATADTWFKVIIDQGGATRYRLKQGGQMRLEAQSAFNLLVGDASCLVLRLNGKPVPIAGKKGEIVAVHLP